MSWVKMVTFDAKKGFFYVKISQFSPETVARAGTFIIVVEMNYMEQRH